MDDGARRVGSTLHFDPIKEKDIIKHIDKLAECHKLGNYISNLLRLAHDSPEVYNNSQEVNKSMDLMKELGASPSRYEYFKNVAREIEVMRRKVDKIYEIAYNNYLLAQMGKKLGLEGKADNTLRASFVLERQLTDMCEALGINDMNTLFVSNKLDDTHKRAEEVLQLLIDSYDDILQEIKDSASFAVQVPVYNAVAVEQPGSTPVTQGEKMAPKPPASYAKADKVIEAPKSVTDQSELSTVNIEKTDENARDISVLDDEGTAALMRMLKGV